MRFLPYNPEQAYLLPPSVSEVLGEGHWCFFVHQVVERMDLSAFEQRYEEEGRLAYHPALLLKVWLCAYMLGITSARRLEQRVREDLGFRYLAAGEAGLLDPERVSPAPSQGAQRRVHAAGGVHPPSRSGAAGACGH